METIIELLLVFVLPVIAAVVAFGSIRKKIAWYAGTAAVVFFSSVVTIVAFGVLDQIARSRSEVRIFDPGTDELISLFVMLVTGIVMIAAAGSGGKSCPACQSRVHPRATRCPKCQADLASTVTTPATALPPFIPRSPVLFSLAAAGIVVVTIVVYLMVSRSASSPNGKLLTEEEIKEMDCRSTKAAYANMPNLSKESLRQLDICNGITPAPAAPNPGDKSLEQLQRETTEMLKK